MSSFSKEDINMVPREHTSTRTGKAETSFVEEELRTQSGPEDGPKSSEIEHLAGTTLVAANIRKNIGPLTMLALCFNICSSWAGLSTSIQIALIQGGPMTLIYGTISTTVIYLCISLVIAELASVYPTAGGQYHFTSILAPEGISRPISYACGLLTCFFWVSAGAAVLVITATQITALAQFYNPDTSGHPWQLFLIYQALNVLASIYNILALKKLPVTHTIGFVLSIGMFITTFVGLLVRSSPKASNIFVWDTFINTTGWPDGVCFITGLLTPAFMYGGLDGSLHLAEEAQNPRKVVPRVCVGVIVVGFCTACPFAITILYSISDFEAIVTSSGFIPFEINRQGLRSDTAATVLLCAGIVLGFFILNAVLQTSSRVLWAFARDEGFAFAHTLSRIHPKLEIPLWATILNSAFLAACGFLILASSIAFEAILSSSAVFQLLSILLPVALLLYRRRSKTFLPRDRQFALPDWLGWTTNIFVAAVIPVLVVFFVLPPFVPVDAKNMNYTSVVLGIVGLFGVLNWFFYARNHYQGPRIVLHL